jgi:hypothetical protein
LNKEIKYILGNISWDFVDDKEFKEKAIDFSLNKNESD